MEPRLRSPESAAQWGAVDPHKASHCSHGSQDTGDLWDSADRALLWGGAGAGALLWVSGCANAP